MEVHTETHKTKKTLFKRVDEILRDNGFYSIDEGDMGIDEPDQYTLRYWFPEQRYVYAVAKRKEGEPFQFWTGFEFEEQPIVLKKGTVLIFDVEMKEENRVWFHCPKLLKYNRAMEMEEALGFAQYGSLSDMLRDGLVTRVYPEKEIIQEPVEESTTPPKSYRAQEMPIPPVEETQELAEPLPEYGSFTTIESTLDMLKSTVGNIAHVHNYTSLERVEGIRTLKVRRSWYHYEEGLCYKRNYTDVPEIQLRGRWLERAGFTYGDFVQVIAAKGMMLIVPVQPPFEPYEGEPI